jgi:AraC-like DNA-binding protein
MVPAGGLHELDTGGDPVAVFYIEPHIAGAHAFAQLLTNSREVNGSLAGNGGEISFFRDIYEDSSSAKWAGQALNDLVSFSRRRAAKEIDPRISRAVEAMYGRYDDLTSIVQIASAAGLSASRFQHLFTQQVGVPFRRYRAWNRMRAAIREIVSGSNFTQAAHAAGFSDQAHFAHDFRKTFGAAASYSLSKVRGSPSSRPEKQKPFAPSSRNRQFAGVTL